LRLKPNCYGCRNRKKATTKNNSVEIEAYLKPSWVLAFTNISPMALIVLPILDISNI
jgi:hypothetical protein